MSELSGYGKLDDLDPQAAPAAVRVPTVDEYDKQDVHSTWGEALGAEFHKTDTATGASADLITRPLQLKMAQANADMIGSKNLSVEELNSKYPNLTQAFSEPTNPFVAEEIAQRQYQKQKLAEAVKGAPSGGLYSTASFGVNLLAHALDPTELGAALLTGGVAEAALGGTVAGRSLGFGVDGILASSIETKATGVVAGTGKTALQNFITGTVEGTAANLATEPLKAMSEKQDGGEYSFKDAMMNAVIGGLTYGALKTGGSAFMKFLKDAPPENIKALQNSSVALLSNDKIPDVTPLTDQMINEASGKVDPSFTPKESLELNTLTPENIKETKFYEAMDGAHWDSTEGRSLPLGDNNGPGRYVTDNPAVANGVSRGTVRTVSLGNLKLETLHEIASPEFKDAVQSAIQGEGIAPNLDLKTGQQVMDEVANELLRQNPSVPQTILNERFDAIQKRIQFEAKIRGIDGFSSVVDSTAGVKHDPYNAIQIFDKEHPELKTESVDAKNSEAVYKPDPKQIQDLVEKQNSPHSDIFYNHEDQLSFDKASEEPLPSPELEDYVKQSDELTKQLQEQTKDYPDPEIDKQLEDLKESEKATNDFLKMVKGAMRCLTKGE